MLREAEDSLNDLKESLKDTSPEVQGAACLALAKVGVAGAAFAPAIAEKSEDLKALKRS